VSDLRIWFLILFHAAGTWAGAQSFPILTYTTAQGLGHQIVYRIYEDRNGFLWFSTDDGLTRFDGRQFRNFGAKDGLRSNFIFGLTENDSAMVIATFGGGLQFTNGFEIDSASRLASGIEFPIEIQQSGETLWVVDRNRSLFRVTRDTVQAMSDFIRYKSKATSHVLQTNLGLVVSAYGVYLWDESLAEMKWVDIRWPGYPVGEYTNSLVQVSNRQLIGTSSISGLWTADLQTGKLQTVLSGDFAFSPHNLLLCADGVLLAAESNGTLWRLSRDLKQATRWLEGVVINDLYEDRQGRIWIATHGQGVWCIPSNSIQVFPHKGLLSPGIGYSRLFQGAVVHSHNRPAIMHPTWQSLHQTPAVLQQPGIAYVYERKGMEEMIVGTTSGIHRVGKRSGHIHLSKSQSAFLVDRRGRYWGGMRMGLIEIDSSFRGYREVPPFKNKIIRSLEDAADTVFVGTHDGLFVQKGNAWTRIGKNEKLSNEYINALAFDSANRVLWIGTNDGLFVRTATGKIETRYPNIRCNSLLQDNRGFLWAATSKGLLWYHSNRFDLLADLDGVPSSLVKLAYDERRDELFCLSNDAVHRIQLTPFIARYAPEQPTLVATEQLIDGIPVGLRRDGFELPASSAAITLRFTTPYFQNSDLWNLYYRVNEKPWVAAGKNRELSFFELPYGRATIDVKLRDEINQVERPPLRLVYFVPTPFYRTDWFLGVVAVAALLIGSVGFLSISRYLNRKKRSEFLAEQRKLELEQKVLRNMLNPHFLNNAVNSIQVFVTRNDQRKTLSYLAKFARLMRVNLEVLEKSVISLDQELHNVELYLEFEKLRFEGKLEYTITVAPDVPAARCEVPSLIIQPFVENAIRHGLLPKPAGGQITICIKKAADQLSIEIEDDGIGLVASQQLRTQDQAHTSKGISLIKDRFEVLNQRRPGYAVYVEEKEAVGSGTRVKLHMPFMVR
jgi:ligand-binding sensor domain-containing protein